MSFDDFIDNAHSKMIALEEEFKEIIKKKEQEQKEKKKEEKEEKSKRIISGRFVEPMSRLKKNSSEVKKGEENPEAQYLLDNLGDIFK